VEKRKWKDRLGGAQHRFMSPKLMVNKLFAVCPKSVWLHVPTLRYSVIISQFWNRYDITAVPTPQICSLFWPPGYHRETLLLIDDDNYVKRVSVLSV